MPLELVDKTPQLLSDVISLHKGYHSLLCLRWQFSSLPTVTSNSIPRVFFPHIELQYSLSFFPLILPFFTTFLFGIDQRFILS